MNGYKGKMGVVVGVADPRMPMHGFLCSGAGCSNDYEMAWWGSIHPLNIYNLKYQTTLVYSYLKKRTLIKWASTNTASFKESHEHKLAGPDCKILRARTRLGLPYASGDAFHSHHRDHHSSGRAHWAVSRRFGQHMLISGLQKLP